MKCSGQSEFCGSSCPDCIRHMDDCDGNDDFGFNSNDEWVELSEAKITQTNKEQDK